MAKKEKEEKEKDLIKEVVQSVQKDYGEDSLRRGLLEGIISCDVIPSGSLGLDIALGVGGVPRGRIIEIYGPESSGKTTLALTVVANTQLAGGVAAFIDAENVLDPSYAAKIGVNLEDLLFSQPDSGEQVMKITEKLVETGKVQTIIIDSVAALVTEEELKGDYEDYNVGATAKLMAKGLGRLKANVRRQNVCLIFINQLRDNIKIGGFGPPGGPTEKTPGGRALKYYASIRMDIRRIGSVKDSAAGKSKDEEADKVGNATRVKVVKNKVAPPFKQAEFLIEFGKGISRAAGAIDLGVKFKLIQKNGGWLSRNEIRLGQGYVSAMRFLEDNLDILKEIEDEIRGKFLPKSTIKGDGSEGSDGS